MSKVAEQEEDGSPRESSSQATSLFSSVHVLQEEMHRYKALQKELDELKRKLDERGKG